MNCYANYSEEEMIDVYKIRHDGLVMFSLELEQDEWPEDAYIEKVKMSVLEYNLLPEFNGW